MKTVHMLLIIIVAYMVIAYTFFIVGQENPLPVPLTNHAEIICPVPSSYELHRQSNTVTIVCLPPKLDTL